MKGMVNGIEKVRGFLGSVQAELKRSSWPTRVELMESTAVVIVSVALFSVFIGFSDMILVHVLKWVAR